MTEDFSLLGNTDMGKSLAPPSTPNDWIACPICRQQNSFGCGHWAWHRFCLAELNPVAFVQWLDGLDYGISQVGLKARIMGYVATVTGMDLQATLEALKHEQEQACGVDGGASGDTHA